MASFRFSKYISMSSDFSCALGEFTKFPGFWP